MLPVVDDDLQNEFEFAEAAAKTYKLDKAVYLILNVERFEHEIYSWDYGVELKDLYGKPAAEAVMELENRISEALLQDSRIQAVADFKFSVTKKTVLAQFTVKTIYGDVKAEKAVNI